MKQANSNNHDKDGQNILYGDGHVAWESNPFVGVQPRQHLHVDDEQHGLQHRHGRDPVRCERQLPLPDRRRRLVIPARRFAEPDDAESSQCQQPHEARP